ncbi:MAG TPA: winged helix-turn-helix domain-containing protein [Nitrososphaeraceae archaeon]|jgi:predicted transcriptional regulator
MVRGRVCIKQYRSRAEIITFILEAARGQKVRHTDILSKASLSHLTFKQYLLLLLRYGLIEYFLNERTCMTTDKGLRFIHVFKEMKNLVYPSDL